MTCCLKSQDCSWHCEGQSVKTWRFCGKSKRKRFLLRVQDSNIKEGVRGFYHAAVCTYNFPAAVEETRKNHQVWFQLLYQQKFLSCARKKLVLKSCLTSFMQLNTKTFSKTCLLCRRGQTSKEGHQDDRLCMWKDNSLCVQRGSEWG